MKTGQGGIKSSRPLNTSQQYLSQSLGQLNYKRSMNIPQQTIQEPDPVFRVSHRIWNGKQNSKQENKN
jgi:hypothetical protein